MALDRKYLLLLLSVWLGIVASHARSEGPQISEGVRVMSQVAERGFGPKGSPYKSSGNRPSISNPQIDRRYRTIVRLPAPSGTKETPK